MFCRNCLSNIPPYLGVVNGETQAFTADEQCAMTYAPSTGSLVCRVNLQTQINITSLYEVFESVTLKDIYSERLKKWIMDYHIGAVYWYDTKMV